MNPFIVKLLNEKFGNNEEEKKQFVNNCAGDTVFYYNINQNEGVTINIIAENCSHYKFMSAVAEFMDNMMSDVTSSDFRRNNGFYIARFHCRRMDCKYSDNFVHKDINFFAALGVLK